MSSRDIHFDGTIPNASDTPRGEVGGLAVFEGVMMRSRTGFAIAQRRADGSIALTQFPWRSFMQRSKPLRIPFFRGIASLSEMMVIGTRAMQFSTAVGEEQASESPAEKSWGSTVSILASLAAMVFFLVIIPDVIPPLMVTFFGAAETFTEINHPIIFNLISGVLRVGILLIYVVGLSLNGDIRRVFEYHGAEHKAVLALEEGRDVTVARARRHDTLHPRCGTTFLALLALLCIPVFALADYALMLHVSGFPDWSPLARNLTQLLAHATLLPVVACLVFELIKFAATRTKNFACRAILAPGFLLQRLTTRRPDDHQLEVAIVALFGALAISPYDREIQKYVVRGLQDDESAPGYIPRSPARVSTRQADEPGGPEFIPESEAS